MTFRNLFLSVSKALMNPLRGLSRKQSWGTARGKLHAFQPKFPLKQLSAVLTHPEPEPLWESHLSEEKISGAKWHFSMLIHRARGREDGLGIDGQTICSRKLAWCLNHLRHFPPQYPHLCTFKWAFKAWGMGGSLSRGLLSFKVSRDRVSSTHKVWLACVSQVKPWHFPDLPAHFQIEDLVTQFGSPVLSLYKPWNSGKKMSQQMLHGQSL